ncbi:hypothetical protein N7474_007825 [Penicillium riverlandense]|uniref:uncharacterized protein n=1 Tax=Penicillium riverlandense TaxID=1903569 RepID=UPI002549AAB0|nr:uncharacterized protein N7474_007825 [Penicillium riverlandense]KAJ5811524.1 hypothetical protein N7474_007825 [Penicillium riverlandense]
MVAASESTACGNTATIVHIVGCKEDYRLELHRNLKTALANSRNAAGCGYRWWRGSDAATSSLPATGSENPYHHLRITVTSGGCHGFQYLMSLEPASKIDVEEDTVFEGEEDVAAVAREAKVVID